MEKRIKRIEIITIISLFLIVGNLIYLISNKTISKNTDTTEIKETKNLSSDITRKYSDKILFKIKNDFNRSEWNKLYDVFGEYAKSQISIDQISSEFKKLRAATGKINTYGYSHYIYEGYTESADWFELHYKCRYDNGKGTIKISTRTVDGISEIVGVVINLDEL
tara:strand:+ start:8446 stop:8940 length:495 start_codon:yes stop_codon:yes gene_type:complete